MRCGVLQDGRRAVDASAVRRFEAFSLRCLSILGVKREKGGVGWRRFQSTETIFRLYETDTPRLITHIIIEYIQSMYAIN
jgi:hypothetical protein